MPIPQVPRRLRWLTPQVRAWALYDVASSSWVAVIPTLLYALYFRSVVAGDSGRADAYWGLTVAAALVVAGIVAPWIGAHADLHRSRLRWIVAATALCCAATAAMPLVGPGQLLAGAAVFVVAQVGYTVGMSLYDAYLTRIATPATIGRVSAFGWSAGFAGGIAAVLVCMGLLAGETVAQGRGYTVVFFAIAALFALVAVPAILGLRGMPDAVVAESTQARIAGGTTTGRILDSLRGWRGHGNVLRLLAAIYLINDAVVTVAFFAGIYFREHFGYGLAELLQLVLLYHVLAAPATLAFGHLCDRISAHAAIYLSLGTWIAAVLLMAFGTGPFVPVAVVALFAAVLGSTQALLRGAYAMVVPCARAAEFFGFNAFASRLSAAAGPLLYGLVSAATGSQQLALLSVLAFLLSGAIVLATVRLQEPPGAPQRAG